MDLAKLVHGLPKTRLSFWEDSYRRTFEASVLRSHRDGGRLYLVLDETLFHPKMGGQPADTGVIRSEGFRLRVRKVMYVSGVVVHFGRIEQGAEPSPGERVSGSIDWDMRYKVMRRHTAGHLLDYCLSETLGRPVYTVESWLGDPCYTAYKGAAPNETVLSKVQETADRLIREGRRVWIESLRWSELVSRYPEAPNIFRLPKGLPSYRVVVIDGCNAVPCSGTHVKDLSEIGRLNLGAVEESKGFFKLYYDVYP